MKPGRTSSPGPNFPLLTTLFLIIRTIYYLHLKEGGKAASQSPYVSPEYWPILPPDTDILGYSLFLLFISVYLETFQGENSKQLLENSCHHVRATKTTLIKSLH